MAVRGTTKSAGKTRTAPVAKVVGDQIDSSRGKGKVTKIGPRTPVEAAGLSAANGRRAGSVEQVGPSEIRPQNGPTGSVTKVGEGNFEDQQAARGGFLDIPYRRQPGSVTQVGPATREYARVLEGTGSAGQPKSGRLPRSSGLVTETPLLISGVGQAYEFGKFVGEPGTLSGAAVKKGAAGDSLLITGRRKRTPSPQPYPSELVTPDGPTIV